ncbi:MAG: trypsin-like peptidase domain-containing protein [candidate division WOR-3 bacterium]|nr:trypsin-like peptidase domain-containing protein [candidate division WOR-3 bacterium]
MKKNLLLIIVVSIVIIVFVLVATYRKPRVVQIVTNPGAIVPTSLQGEISLSRTTAIVLAARKVSPAVVSITVIQERVVTTSPFLSPFADRFWDDFFRDFFPPRQYKEQIQSLGSGVIINEQGDIVTNAHVVEGATKIKVTLPDGRQFDGELVDINRTNDLALLKIKGKDLPYATLGNSDDLMIGEWCIAFGNPFGFLLEDAQPSITVGVISALNRNLKPGQSDGREFKNMIQTDAAINPGNSGGPLTNALGEVIGINTFIFSRSGGSEGIGFAIPINNVKKFIAQSKENAKKIVSEEKIEKIKTKIGLTVSDNNFTLMKKYNLTTEDGVVVVEVERNSIGAMLGISPGDIIISINNQRPKNAKDFARLAELVTNQLDMAVNRQGEQIRIFYRF